MRTNVQSTSAEAYHNTDRRTFKADILAHMVQQSAAGIPVSIGSIARHFNAEKSTISGLFNAIKKDGEHTVDGVRYTVVPRGTEVDKQSGKTVQVFALERIGKVPPPLVTAPAPQPTGTQLQIF